MKPTRISVKKLPIFLHIIAWTILFILPTYLLYLDSFHSTIDSFFLLMSMMQVIAYIIVFYINYFLLVPKLFFGNRKVAYFLSVLALIIIIGFLFESTRTIFEPRHDFPMKNETKMDIPERFGKPPDIPDKAIGPDKHDKGGPSMKRPIYDYLLVSVMICGFGIGLRFSEKLIKNEKEKKESEKEKLNSELAFLKNQISPHFFFNTLNNIYSLVQINSEDGQKAILQLSKLMRYLLYESEKGNIKLSQEIDFIKNYIELMKLRVSNKVDIFVSFPDKYPDKVIPPLLFIPFIENAFKHGISYLEASSISIVMKIDEEELFFWCSNRIIHKPDENSLTDSGIGLENVTKRLVLLFPDTHKLVIDQSENLYKVNLRIDISNNIPV